MNPEEILRRNREALAAAMVRRQTATAAIQTLREADPATITDDQITAAMNARSEIDAEIDELERAAGELRAEIERNAAMERLAGQTVPNSGARSVPVGTTGTERSPAVVISEPRTYTEHSNRGGAVSFFADAWRARSGNGLDVEAAQARLERHQREVAVEGEGSAENRATTTTSFGSLVIPQYLVDMVAPILRNGRPTANICARHQLPSRGMSLIIPRLTTGTAAAVQASQNTAVASQDPAVTDLTIPVATIAGQADISRQALERGENIDSLVYADLARVHAVAVDVQVLSGSGTAGQVLGIFNTAGISQASAYTAAATAASFNLKVAGGIAAVSSAGAGLYPKVIVAHPRRWAWLTGQLDSSGRPIVMTDTMSNHNAMGLITQPGQISADSDPVNGAQVIGLHNSGLPVLTDLNLPTAVGTGPEDQVLIGDNTEWHLWEEGNGLPRELKFDQTLAGQLTVKLVVYSYVAFTAGRYPQATAVLGGNSAAGFGQIAPTF